MSSERFVELSALLTGFGPMELWGTGMADEYMRAVDDILPAGTLDALLDAGLGPERILADPRFGAVARNLIVVWYCGTWTQLPDWWRSAYGASEHDTTHVLSAGAYQAGLQWVAAGAHPAGAAQQGYGAWALAPGRSAA